MAFDVVKHIVLLSKLSALDLPSSILNWITFLTFDLTYACLTLYIIMLSVYVSAPIELPHLQVSVS